MIESMMSPNLYSTESEQTLLGCVLLGNEILATVSGVVTADDFFHESHAEIFKACTDLSEFGVNYDPVTIIEKLKSMDVLESCGGMSHIADMCESVPVVDNAIEYAKIVKEKSTMRKVYQFGVQAMAMASDPTGISTEVLSEVQSLVLGVDEAQTEDGAESAIDIFKDYIHHVKKLQAGEIKPGYMTGLTDYDKRTNGWQDSDLIVIGARPSMGKTAFLINAMLAGAQRGEPVQFYSLESSKRSIIARAVCTLVGISMDKAISGKFDEEESQKLVLAAAKIKKAKLCIDDSSGLTIGQVRSRTRKNAKKFGMPRLIAIDHLKQIRFPGKGNLVNEIGEVTKQCKAMAKEFGCPVVLLCQLNRSVEQRPLKQPMLSDLRDSGEIEQDADVVTMLYRDEYYNKDTERKGVLDLLTVKMREGEIGGDAVVFDGAHMKIKDLNAEAFHSQQHYAQ